VEFLAGLRKTCCLFQLQPSRSPTFHISFAIFPRTPHKFSTPILPWKLDANRNREVKSDVDFPHTTPPGFAIQPSEALLTCRLCL